MYILSGSKLIEIFVEVDDFCKEFEKWSREQAIGEPPSWGSSLSQSEVMSILIFYHLSGFKCFKYYYLKIIRGAAKDYFPKAVSYTRFVELIPLVGWSMFLFGTTQSLKTKRTDKYYIDSKKLCVCHVRRAQSNKVFKGIARKGKTSTGWFFGLKIHLVINHLGECVRFLLTSGNVADNNENILSFLLKDLKGKCFGDKGYLTKLFESFYLKGLHLITKTRKNMKNQLIEMKDQLLLRKRGVIESVFDILAHICDIDHSRHRSPQNAFVNLFAGLCAYNFIEVKPSIFNKVKMRFLS